ncbi:MAG TPA: RNA methyltransferase [Polyangiaceae bacterium]|jgi:TrmH RNA methyltransferase
MVQRPRPPHRPRHDDTETTQGLRAGLALVAARPDDVLRIAFARELRHELVPLLRTAAAHSLDCRETTGAELDRIAGSGHHEGLLVEARPRRWLSSGELAELLVRVRGTALALDRVRNPYNVGAALRGAAFFGVDAALLGAPAPHPGLPPTAVRVAEGGVERVALARTTDLADTLGRLRSRGVKVVGTDGEAPEDALAFAFARPTVLVMGNEREGLGDRVRAQCDAVVAIRGSGAVESLNVAVAAGVLAAAMTRRR